ncbi:MAG: hypothetical protein NT163_09770 [Chlorobiales bacterium]|nr:hypothetical protein [Chlorobiales bacterium]
MSANVSIVSVAVTDVDHNNAYSSGDIVAITFSEPMYARECMRIISLRHIHIQRHLG